MNVNGRFVIVGVTAKGVMPQLAIPNGQLLEPHKIQGALAESILVEKSPFIPDYALAVEVLVLMASLVAIWLFINGLGITWGISLAFVVFVSTGVSGALLIRSGLLIDVSWTLISQFITGAVAFYLNFREQYKLRQLIKKQFEHYLDPRQVKRLQANPELLKLGGEKREATFLFTDVRGFTSLSEALPPEDVVYIMNRALTAQADAVLQYEGTVDKYIGDAMMAIFNAPFDQEDHETRAVQCAYQITENMLELNKELDKKNLPLVAIGIGINTGEAVIGNMGSAKRFDYTAIGDAVNTAARLESATKEHGATLLVGEQTAKKCEFKLHYHKDIEVKGKKIGLKTYTWDLS
jgi:adenylate cyclase